MRRRIASRRSSGRWTTGTWRKRINEYLGVLRARIAELPQDEAEPAAAWLAWCEVYAEALDPLKKRLRCRRCPNRDPRTCGRSSAA
jgi:hypothetical protein